MRKLPVTLLLVMALVATVAACDDANSCDAGEERICECEDGSMGVQVCQDDGTWGPCQCDAGD
jgi:hypothetical protein